MPPRYFLANTPEDVVAHAQLSVGCAAGSVSVSLRPSPHEGVLGMCVVTGEQQPTGLCVVAGDQPGSPGHHRSPGHDDSSRNGRSPGHHGRAPRLAGVRRCIVIICTNHGTPLLTSR